MNHLPILSLLTLVLTVSACACENSTTSLHGDRTEECLAQGFAMDSPAYANCMEGLPSEEKVQQLRNTVGGRNLQGF